MATTRPETMFGDVALAVHPDDERYVRYIDRCVMHPVRNVPIPVVADSVVQKEFGTGERMIIFTYVILVAIRSISRLIFFLSGVLKITPAHDRTDYDVAKRHNLPVIGVINEDGNMMDVCKGFEVLSKSNKILFKLCVYLHLFSNDIYSTGIAEVQGKREATAPIVCSRSSARRGRHSHYDVAALLALAGHRRADVERTVVREMRRNG